MNAELKLLMTIAAEAAKLIMEVYARPFDVDYKGPQDPVTEADRRANDLICERLEQAFPGVPIVAEESDPATFAGFRSHDRVFFVDPVDGTREFVDRNGEFACSRAGSARARYAYATAAKSRCA
jgi:3'(2'), 5'-bisphosphate nucleotidase